jgi:hypothetical protein
MNLALSLQKRAPFFTKRRLGWASLAAVCGCGAACAAPLLVVAAGGGATASAILGLLGAGKEIVVGGLAFAGALGVMALRSRSRAASGAACTVGTTELPDATTPSPRAP